jgi:hypothetical protein
MVRRLVHAVAAVIAFCAMTIPAAAQTTGTITGTVKDPQGGVVPGATVTLTSDSRGTQLAEVVSDSNGDFSFINVPPDRYTVQVSMSGFKPTKQSGISVSPGDRNSVGTFTIEVGALTDQVTVRAEAPLVQARSGERSFTVPTSAVENLPIANRSFTAIAALAPGVTTSNGLPTGDPIRIGGGGDTNIMMDGVGVMDTGSNRPLLQMNVESIAEVKILTSGYQAEFGRSSGLQITAVTKSGTNRFRGSVYDVERNSDWYSNSKANKLNGNPKTVLKEKDWGFSIGGPIGKPGGTNNLFFFYSQEFSPRTFGNDIGRYRFPTAAERNGDFSASLDQNGALYNFIKNPSSPNPCTAANTTGCYADGGVVGRIPASALYQPGLNILRQYPMPNIDGTGQGWNYEFTRPTQNILSWQPAARVDWTPTSKLRVTGKYSGWQQRRDVIQGTLPGFNDTQMQRPVISNLSFSGNYNLNATTFIEATYGRSRNELAGCALAQSGTGPSVCRNAIVMNENANRNNNGLGGLPLLFPDAPAINPDYYAYQALEKMDPKSPAWVNGQFQKPPTFTWGNRINSSNTPPNLPFPSYFNVNATQDLVVSLTKVMGRHTVKTGYFNTHSYKAEQATNDQPFGAISFQQDTVGTNPFDTSFGFANAATGAFSSFTQASAYVEGNFVYDNREAYLQDNWRVNNRLTLDYGMRFVHATPQYDKLGQATNFLPDKWSASNAPRLYLPGCSITIAAGTACPSANIQAVNPVTGQLLGPNSSLAIGTLVGGTGSLTNGLFKGGDGIVDTTYTFPKLAFAPRFGMAYDVTGQQKMILRGGVGLYYDRPFGNSVISMSGNPPASRLVTVRYGQLQSLGQGGLTTQGPPGLNTIQYDAKLPSSTQFSAGMQTEIPWSTMLDIEWVGQHSFNTVRTVNINTVDLGSAFLPQNQDPTKVSATPGGAALSNDLMRPMRGYGSINHRMFNGARTFHSLQMSVNRRFANGYSFGFNDTWVLYDHQLAGLRLRHNADGSFAVRDDQAQADELFGTFVPTKHVLKGNFVWDLPDLRASAPALKVVGHILNDWQLSGIWTGSTGGPTNNGAGGAYNVGYSYSSGGSNLNITGSNDFGGRVRIVGDPGSGCSSDPYRQFNVNAFQGPLTGSDGLESPSGYLRGCFQSQLDLSIARNIRMGGTRNLQLRVDMFNAPNEARITGRNGTMNLASPADPVTITNLPYDAQGNILPNRVRPANAGFGQANAWQRPREVQVQVKFSF